MPFIQALSADAGFAGSNVITKAITFTAGSGVVWFVDLNNFGGATAFTVAVTDTLGNTYTPRRTNVTGNEQNFWGECKNNVGGSTTVTVTVSGVTGTDTVDYLTVILWESSNLDTSTLFLDYADYNFQFGPGTGTDAVTTGTTGTLSAQPAVIIALCIDESGIGTANPGTGFTSRGVFGNRGGAAGNERMRLEDKRLTATTATNATFTSTSAVDWYASYALVVKEAAAGGGVVGSNYYRQVAGMGG